MSDEVACGCGRSTASVGVALGGVWAVYMWTAVFYDKSKMVQMNKASVCLCTLMFEFDLYVPCHTFGTA